MTIERLTNRLCREDVIEMLENPLYKSQSETWLRLCDIEDILGDDYDLDHLRELIRADRYELRYGPTFKIGDSVWQTDGIDVYELKVKRLIYDCGYIAFDAAAVGKRIFKTSSDAEAAMEKTKEAAHE